MHIHTHTCIYSVSAPTHLHKCGAIRQPGLLRMSRSEVYVCALCTQRDNVLRTHFLWAVGVVCNPLLRVDCGFVST